VSVLPKKARGVAQGEKASRTGNRISASLLQRHPLCRSRGRAEAAPLQKQRLWKPTAPQRASDRLRGQKKTKPLGRGALLLDESGTVPSPEPKRVPSSAGSRRLLPAPPPRGSEKSSPRDLVNISQRWGPMPQLTALGGELDPAGRPLRGSQNVVRNVWQSMQNVKRQIHPV